MRGRPVVLYVILGALLIFAVGFGGAFMFIEVTSGEPHPTSTTPPPPTPPATTLPTPPEEQPSAVAIAPGAVPTTEPTPLDTPTVTDTPTPEPTDTPYPTATPEASGGPVTVPNNHTGPRWVALQAGHWNTDQLPEELSHLSLHTGASAGGVNEVDINVAVARLTAERLKERGFKVDLLDATVPPNYTADLFLALHADGSNIASVRGFKAVAPWGSMSASDKFVGFLYEEYGKATGLPTDARTTA